MGKVAVATRKGLLTFDTTDSRMLSSAFVGEPVTAVLADDTGQRWIAALRLGHYGVKMHTSDDGGVSWREIATPQYPPKPKNADDPNPWTLDQVWILEGFHPLAPQRIWAGTVPGGLFRSDDAGASWTLVRSLWDQPSRPRWFGGGYDHPGIHSICVHPQNPNDIVVGISCGGVWRSQDGGQSWTVGTGMRANFMPPENQLNPEAQDPHRLVQCAAKPERMWVQHHCGIWLSDDRGATWQEITTAQPSNFGFAVAVHPHHPDQAWFVPLMKDVMRVPVNGETVVSHTADGGKSFVVLREGLPASNAYTLVYRHGLDVNDQGQLIMGSTTGDLWCSNDRRFITLSRDLSPIYAVRWAGESNA